MDAIHEYLLLKGVQAAAIHGGKDQEDRIKAVAEFRWEIHMLIAAFVETLNPTKHYNRKYTKNPFKNVI